MCVSLQQPPHDILNISIQDVDTLQRLMVYGLKFYRLRLLYNQNWIVAGIDAELWRKPPFGLPSFFVSLLLDQ